MINKDIDELIDLNTIVKKNIDIDDTDIDGEKVMMNIEIGQYYMFNEIASRIWTIIGEGVSIKDIINLLLKEYDVDEQICKKSILEFINKLKEDKLIETI